MQGLDEHIETIPEYEETCPECGEPCRIITIDESFDYAGTHCTHGKAGTHQGRVYRGSDCCEAEIDDY